MGIEFDIEDLDRRIQNFERILLDNKLPYFLVGLKYVGDIVQRDYLAVFSSECALEDFVEECRLLGSRKSRYRKGTLLHGYDRHEVDRFFYPNLPKLG
jgi:hypothetical protein